MRCPACDQETPKRSEAQLLEEIKELELRNYVERTRADSYQAVTRDSFATAALTGLIASDAVIERDDFPRTADLLAATAYEIADAMLEARKLKPE